jgi:hypothetical protein
MIEKSFSELGSFICQKYWMKMFFLDVTFFSSFFFGVPHFATCIFLIFYNEPELGAEIDPDMAWL